jgi:hypothetical protein
MGFDHRALMVDEGVEHDGVVYAITAQQWHDRHTETAG